MKWWWSFTTRNLPESKAVAAYYARMRNVPEKQVYGFDLPATETMSRDDFSIACSSSRWRKNWNPTACGNLPRPRFNSSRAVPNRRFAGSCPQKSVMPCFATAFRSKSRMIGPSAKMNSRGPAAHRCSRITGLPWIPNLFGCPCLKTRCALDRSPDQLGLWRHECRAVKSHQRHPAGDPPGWSFGGHCHGTRQKIPRSRAERFVGARLFPTAGPSLTHFTKWAMNGFWARRRTFAVKLGYDVTIDTNAPPRSPRIFP